MSKSKKKLAVLAVIGTRPEAIKTAPVVLSLRSTSQCQVHLCATAQHRDLLDKALMPFRLKPDFDLNLMRPKQDLADLTGRILRGVRDVVRLVQPDWILVQGDTTTAFASSLAAFYEKVPVVHIEAGLRTGDIYAPWPEEVNRRLISEIATLHMAPTESARKNLLREGIADSRIFVTGNTGIDALFIAANNLRFDSTIRERLLFSFPFLKSSRKLILVTGHRRENFGNGLDEVCRALRILSGRDDVQIAYVVHPNPQVKKTTEKILANRPNVHLIPPLDYLQFIFLMKRAYLIITDSGGVQEEAPSLGKPVLVTRDVTERPEAVKAGTVRLIGPHENRLVEAVNKLLDDAKAYRRMTKAHNPYGDGHAAKRIVKELIHAKAI